MNNKGFSLMELLAVILILGLIARIAIPIVQSQIEEAANKTYEKNVSEIESAAKNWVIVYGNTVEWNLDSATGIKTYKLELEELKKTEFLADEYIKNPLNEVAEMNGCIIITLSTSDIYTYKYYEGCEING